MYRVVKGTGTRWRRDSDEQVLDTGGTYDDLRAALIECNARNIIDARQGLSPVWSVDSDDPAAYDTDGRLRTAGVQFDESDIRRFLVDQLNLSEGEVKRLIP